MKFYLLTFFIGSTFFIFSTLLHANPYPQDPNSPHDPQDFQSSHNSSLRPLFHSYRSRWYCMARGFNDFVPFTTTAYGPTRHLAAKAAIRKCKQTGILGHACAIVHCRRILRPH